MKRILFVDDEPNVLAGLRRMLRDHRHDWEMAFVDSGQAALSAFAEQPFDVIVTDMRMPGMSGAELLSHVHEAYPEAVRIVLSGHAEFETALRVLPVAHQFLSKPCDPQRLKDVVDRCCNLQEMLSNEVVRKTVNSIDALPARPEVHEQLTAAVADPDVDLGRLEQIVRQDAALCAKLLQIVNSGFFGLPRAVTAVREAISYLGISLVKSTALTLGVYQQIDVKALPRGYSIEGEHDQAMLTASITRLIAPDRAPRETLFSAGVLLDVGKLVLASKLRADYERVLALAEREHLPVHVAEDNVLGLSHAEIGGYLLALWGLPYPIVEAVCHHHAPSRTRSMHFDHVGVVHIAHGMASWFRDGRVSIPDDPLVAFDTEYLDATGVTEKVPGWWTRAAAAISSGATT